MKVIECPQRSNSWFQARLGIPTSSAFDKIVTSTGEPSKQAQGYLYTLAAERIAGIAELSYSSGAMAEGERREEESRMVYAMLREVEVSEVGFCLSDCGRYGCSPDGLIGSDGLVELKNPIGKTQIEYLLKAKLPTAYVQQVQGQLLVTGRSFCDFVGYYPGLPTLIVRVERNKMFLAALEVQLETFCDALDELCERITKSGGG